MSSSPSTAVMMMTRELGSHRANALGRLDPAHLRHSQIHQRHIWFDCCKHLDGFLPVRRLGDDVQAAVRVEHLHQSRTYHWVIVDDQESDHGNGGYASRTTGQANS